MRKFPLFIVVLWMALLGAAVASEGARLYCPPKAEKISSGLRALLSKKAADDMVKAWVFFTDKGVLTEEGYSRALKEAERGLTTRAKRRRLKGRASSDLVSYCDLPVERDYVEKIASLGAKVEVVSKWLNGMTVRAPVRLIYELERFGFVRELRKVVTYVEPVAPTFSAPSRPPSPGVPLYYEYGLSGIQDSMLAIPDAHAMGFTGAGVLICILDTGFDFDRTGAGTGHSSLFHVREHLVAEWDFLSNDAMTGYDPENDSIDQLCGPDQTRHGTWMLSMMAGYKNGNLIGPAFGASLALARTELLEANIIAEEDWWIAGMEWADSLGADIVSSSLGFKDFQDATDYGYSGMDGETFPVSMVADSAAKLGILVVNAMGNVIWTWETTRPDTCIKAPADADSIIAVGGVGIDSAWTFSGTTSGSAIGPTYDQRDSLGQPLPRAQRTRWKPDVVGPWEHIFCDPDTRDEYLGGTGTSGATAIVAGACALVWEANPSWSNREVRERLLYTASNCSLPNDTIGWGIPNVVAAIGEPELPPRDTDGLGDPYPNPFKPTLHPDGVVFPYWLLNECYPFLRIYTASGELVKEFDLAELAPKMPGRYTTPPTGAIVWDGHNEAGDLVGSGIYICMLTTTYNTSVKKLAVVR